nr:hypothetical protein [Tanacetum cinerariifolium]
MCILNDSYKGRSISSNDNTNVVNVPQKLFIFNQDPGENSSQSPPHIDHHFCYGCGDSLDGIFCQRCTCESCGNGAYIGYNCPPKVSIISNLEQCYNQNIDEFLQTSPSFHPTCYSGDENSFTYDSNLNFVDDSPNLTILMSFVGMMLIIKIPIYYDDDDDEESSFPLRDIIISELLSCIAITPILSTKEPVDSLIMEDEHLDTISATKSDEVIKSSVEDLVPIPNDDYLFEDIDYVKESPPDFEPVSLEDVKDEILRVKLLNVNLLIGKIESLNDNPTPDRVLKSPSPFPIPIENEPDQVELTSVVMEYNLGEPRVHVPNVLPTYPTFHLDPNFILSSDYLRSDLVVSFPSGTRNKIFDPKIFFEV